MTPKSHLVYFSNGIHPSEVQQLKHCEQNSFVALERHSRKATWSPRDFYVADSGYASRLELDTIRRIVAENAKDHAVNIIASPQD